MPDNVPTVCSKHQIFGNQTWLFLVLTKSSSLIPIYIEHIHITRTPSTNSSNAAKDADSLLVRIYLDLDLDIEQFLWVIQFMVHCKLWTDKFLMAINYTVALWVSLLLYRNYIWGYLYVLLYSSVHQSYQLLI